MASRHRANRRNPFLAPVIVVTVLPLPDYPLSLTPFVVVALMLIGFVVMKIIERRRPEALAWTGAIMVTDPDR